MSVNQQVAAEHRGTGEGVSLVAEADVKPLSEVCRASLQTCWDVIT